MSQPLASSKPFTVSFCSQCDASEVVILSYGANPPSIPYTSPINRSDLINGLREIGICAGMNTIQFDLETKKITHMITVVWEEHDCCVDKTAKEIFKKLRNQQTVESLEKPRVIRPLISAKKGHEQKIGNKKCVVYATEYDQESMLTCSPSSSNINLNGVPESLV